jgi:hypothetical protein
MYSIPRLPLCLSPRPNWDPPMHPRSRKRVCPPPEPKGDGAGGTHSPACEGGGVVPIRTAGEEA